MIKKSIVILQCLIALVLGVLLLSQSGLSPERARRIDRREPLWFMNPWRPGDKSPETPSAAAQSKTTLDESSRGAAARRYILTPGPAIDTMITDLEAKSLEPATSVLAPAQGQSQTGTPAGQILDAKKTPGKTPPIRLNDVTVSQTPDGARITGVTSSAVERLDVLAPSGKNQVVVELAGHFSRYEKRISVPQNPCVRAVWTTLATNVLRLVIDLKKTAAPIAPVAQVTKEGFEVKLLLPSPDRPAASTPKE